MKNIFLADLANSPLRGFDPFAKFWQKKSYIPWPNPKLQRSEIMEDLNANEKSIKPQDKCPKSVFVWAVKNNGKQKIIFDHNKSVRSAYHKPGPQSSILSEDYTDSLAISFIISIAILATFHLRGFDPFVLYLVTKKISVNHNKSVRSVYYKTSTSFGSLFNLLKYRNYPPHPFL